MTDEEFAGYERKVREVLGRCGCDEHWPNELCHSCKAIVDRYLMVCAEMSKEPSHAG